VKLGHLGVPRAVKVEAATSGGRHSKNVARTTKNATLYTGDDSVFLR
jgi:hypothetical protein